MLRLVTYLPSLPAKGLLLTRNVIVSVGGSISMGSIGVGFSRSHTLSPISTPLQTDKRDDVAGLGLGDVGAAEALEELHLRGAGVARAAAADEFHRLVGLDAAAVDAADADAADVLVVRQRLNPQPQRPVHVGDRGRDVGEDFLEHGLDRSRP